ncbi:MAG: N-acetylmuramoyl-L-alanine amidase [Tissierella sp.]|nr:N-acetylmuramoyl-L-alanine amidase [Tissierella sp.]
MVKVFLDPGHGGKDPGAVGNNLREKDITLAVALKVGQILKRHNVEVLYSRTTDVFVDLTPRANMANNAKADVFVSIHVNSFNNPSAQGLETFSHTGSIKGAELAKDIQDSLLQAELYTKNRGIKTANFTVIAKSTMPAVLVELAFISNIDDSKILRNQQLEIAESVAKGILKNLGIKYVEKKEESKKEKELDTIKFNLHGRELEVEGIYKDNTNYIPIRFLEKLGYKIDWKDGTVIVDYREVK